MVVEGSMYYVHYEIYWPSQYSALARALISWNLMMKDLKALNLSIPTIPMYKRAFLLFQSLTVTSTLNIISRIMTNQRMENN